MADSEKNSSQLTGGSINPTLENHSDYGGLLNARAALLNDKYQETGKIEDLEEGIRLSREAVDATSNEHANYAKLLSNLGVQLGIRYTRKGNKGDLDEAIKLAREAVDSTRQSHPDRAEYSDGLGIVLGERYLNTGTMSDLEEAIIFAREAVDLTPRTHQSRSQRSTNLGNHLGNRYSRTGNMTDLEETIHFARDAVETSSKENPDHTKFLTDLAAAFGQRYFRLGTIVDLDGAIRLATECLEITPPDHLDHAVHISNIGIWYRVRYSRTGNPYDLEEAIRLAVAALDALPDGHPFYAGYLATLSNGLGKRYARRGAMSDLDTAIAAIREAISVTAKDHPRYPVYLSFLSNHLGEKFAETEILADLEAATKAARESVDLTPEDHSARTHRLNELGFHLSMTYTSTRSPIYHKEAISKFKLALEISSSPDFDRIDAGVNLLDCYAHVSDWEGAYQTAQSVMRLLPKISPRSLSNSDKQHALSQIPGFASDGAAMAINAGKGPLAALALLEEGHGLIAASLEEMRIDVLELQNKHPKLADQFVRLTRDLEISPPEDGLGESRTHNWQTLTDQRHQAAKELDALITQVRQEEGFEDFLLAPSESQMCNAAKLGPIVVINISKFRCDAILVEENQIRLLPLPNLHSFELYGKIQTGDLGNRRVLKWLWDIITEPILHTLGFIEPPPDDQWPRIWWIPTGRLNYFPLHAAGNHSLQSYDAVCDRVMSSYSSSIRTIINSRQRPPTPPSANLALIVAMEHTPRQSRLPFATKEVQVLHDICKSMDLNPVEPQRCKSAILSSLVRSKIFHFAGHGFTHKGDPSKSHLLLEDVESGPLTVADLFEMNLRKHSPFLAYLSACGTGQIKDERFVDENISLISAFQLAGFRHVIGTLWEVNDELCVDVAMITYEVMKDEGMKDKSICHGLHKALRELRARWLQEEEDVTEFDTSLDRETALPLELDSGESKNGALSRDVTLCVGGDDFETQRSPGWVPYIHFGI